MTTQAEGIAKVTWDDPDSGQRHEFVLSEGATASIGRSAGNDIIIPQRHVSRQHAVIAYRDGIFMINDLGSANGTFVNDRRLTDPFPLAHGDIIRLYVPTMTFSAIVTEAEQEEARKTGSMILPLFGQTHAKLQVTGGIQEGTEFILLRDTMTVGRMTVGAIWDIAVQDRAVSRPHCRLQKQGNNWLLIDMGSANGTFWNGTQIEAEQPIALKDGDVLNFGETTLLFRA